MRDRDCAIASLREGGDGSTWRRASKPLDDGCERVHAGGRPDCRQRRRPKGTMRQWSDPDEIIAAAEGDALPPAQDAETLAGNRALSRERKEDAMWPVLNHSTTVSHDSKIVD